MMHEQFLSKYQYEIARMIQAFIELNSAYENQYCLYMDSDGWEIFDTRVGRPIFKGTIRQVGYLFTEMRKLTNDITAVFLCRSRINRNQRMKRTHFCSCKRLSKIYDLEDTYFFTERIKNYIKYGFNEEESNY